MDKKTKMERLTGEVKRNRQLYLMMLIPFAYIVIFKYFPMVGAQIAFKNYTPVKGIWGSEWVGLKHFIRFFHNPKSLEIVKNTFLLCAYSILFGFWPPILLAIGIDYMNNKFFKRTVQMVSFVPHFLSTVIVVSLMFMLLDNRIGVVNNLLNLIIGHKVNFLGKSSFFRALYVGSGIWQNVGWNSVLYIAALSGVDPQIHEAAVVDGANKVKRIWHIDIPSIAPTIAIMLIMNLGSLLSVGFEKVFLMQNPINLKLSEVLSTYEYKSGIGGAMPNYSYGVSIGLMTSAVNFILIVLSNRISNKLTGNGIW